MSAMGRERTVALGGLAVTCLACPRAASVPTPSNTVFASKPRLSHSSGTEDHQNTCDGHCPSLPARAVARHACDCVKAAKGHEQEAPSQGEAVSDSGSDYRRKAFHHGTLHHEFENVRFGW